MYDIAMSSNGNGGKNSNLDASYLGPVAEVDYLTDVSDLDFDESDKGGIGTLLMKGGTFCLIAALIFTGYQFVPQGEVQQKNFESHSLHDWEKKTDKVASDVDYMVSIERRFAAAKAVDLATTGSTSSPTNISNLIEKNQDRVIQLKENSTKSKADKKVAKNKLYIVQAGDTLSKIARMFKTSSKTIIAMNEIDNPSLIRPGMRLIVTK